MNDLEKREEEEAVEKKGNLKKALVKAWDVFVVLFGIFLFIIMLAFFQTIQETKVTEEKKETISLEKLQKEVDILYKTERPTTSQIFDMYQDLRTAEKTFIKKAKTSEEKTSVHVEILSMKEDVLMLQKKEESYERAPQRVE